MVSENEMKKEEIDKVLENHKLWRSSQKKDGACANLSGVDLSFAYLRDANLCDADITGVDLYGADLRDADMRLADLSGTDLRGADLIGTVLIGANLRDVNLLGANLLGANLLGVNLRGAKNIQSFQCGKSSRVCYAVRHADCVMFQIECFWGTSEQAIEKIREDYGDASHYEMLVSIYSDPDFWITNGHGETKEAILNKENKMIDNCIHNGTLDPKPDEILVYAQSESLLSKKTRMAKMEVESEIHFTETLIHELSELVIDAKAELIRINEFLETDFITEAQLCNAWDNLELISSIWIEELGIEADFHRNQSCDWVVIEE
jgi:hypothetical protein